MIIGNEQEGDLSMSSDGDEVGLDSEIVENHAQDFFVLEDLQANNCGIFDPSKNKKNIQEKINDF